MQITPFGGVGEIGGNKILLEDGKTRIWLDFGASFDGSGGYYVDWLAPRKVYGLLDHFEFGLLPKLKGLYSGEQLAYTDLAHCDPKYDAVFLSHAHWDHVIHTSFLDRRIPIYCGETTQRILETWQQVSSGYAPDLCCQDLVTFRSGDSLKVGAMKVKPTHVDHSIPGSYGFLVKTSAGTVAYTGDLRMHGAAGQLTEDFIRAATKAKPVALICEGTRVGGDPPAFRHTEEYVLEESTKIAKKSPGLVIADFRRRDFDRLRTFFRVAQASKRALVISLHLACLLDHLSDDPHLEGAAEMWKARNLKVFFPRKKDGSYDEGNYFVWERDYMERMVTVEDLQNNQNKYLWCLELSKFPELISVRPVPGSAYIHSLSEFRSEEDPGEALMEEAMWKWVEHFGLTCHQIHASGHAPESEIRQMVERIRPKYVIPVHTQHPEAFQGWGPTVKIPVLGQPIPIG